MTTVDISTCPYYRGTGTCTFGCRDYPQCMDLGPPETRCAVTELPVGQCACKRCRPDLAKFAPPHILDPFDDPAELAPLIKWFRAKYDGECTCGNQFDAGDAIRPDGRGAYVAECCGDDE